MTKKSIIFLSLLLLVPCSIILIAGTCHAHIYKLADGSIQTLDEVIKDLRQAQIIFVGETHDKPGHHRAQLQIIKELKKNGAKVAIGLEMFRSDSQHVLDQWVAGQLSFHEFIKSFYDNWSDFDQYREIFNHAYSAKSPLVGLNLSRSITQQVAREGFDSLSKEQLSELPIVSCNVDPAYEKFIRRALGGHQNNGINFKNFCEAQLLWDSVMAENLLAYLNNNTDHTVVVLAGSGHSWKHGIPSWIKKQSAYTFRVLLPEVVGRTETGLITEADADYLMLGVDEAELH